MSPEGRLVVGGWVGEGEDAVPHHGLPESCPSLGFLGGHLCY